MVPWSWWCDLNHRPTSRSNLLQAWYCNLAEPFCDICWNVYIYNATSIEVIIILNSYFLVRWGGGGGANRRDSVVMIYMRYQINQLFIAWKVFNPPHTILKGGGWSEISCCSWSDSWDGKEERGGRGHSIAEMCMLHNLLFIAWKVFNRTQKLGFWGRGMRFLIIYMIMQGWKRCGRGLSIAQMYM